MTSKQEPGDDRRKQARADTIRQLMPAPAPSFPIESVLVEAVNLLTGPETVMVINRGLHTETVLRSDRVSDDLSAALVALLTYEARNALQRRSISDIDPIAATPIGCALCGLGPGQSRREVEAFVHRCKEAGM